MDNPNSPYAVACSLVAELQNGQRSQEDFLQALDVFYNFLNQHFQQIEAISSPDDYADAEGMKGDSLNGLEVMADAVGMLRDYADSRDDGLAQEALDRLREGQDILGALLQETNENIERLEDELG